MIINNAYQMEYYLQNYNKEIDGKKEKDILEKIAIHYIPMANPDGHFFQLFYNLLIHYIFVLDYEYLLPFLHMYIFDDRPDIPIII